VISSYLIANEETWRRGVTLSFASALLQAIVAVGVAAAVLNATAATMTGAVNAIETVSYGLIVPIGARLSWVKGRAFIAAFHALNRPVGEVGPAATSHRHHLGLAHLARDPKRAERGRSNPPHGPNSTEPQ
jgi:nickel/cobalt exporter